jgi:predicted dehydrogenase
MLFANRFSFNKSYDLDEFVTDEEINTVFILSPNKVHYEHLKAAIEMASVKHIYLEKPVCSNPEEEKAIADLIKKHPDVKIQVGFQYLFATAIREMLSFWKSRSIGIPLHFDLKYYHGDYLHKGYRDRRHSRLTAAPEGGAMADLGSHAISLIIAFLGKQIKITAALQSGHFEDVTADSDLFSLISLYDNGSKAVGTLSASRISCGAGDYISFELYAENGALRYSSDSSDSFEYYKDESGVWCRQMSGSSYKPASSFPSPHVPSGWLRSLIHAHYVFLTGKDSKTFIPDIEHGLAVQRLVNQTADHLEIFRKLINRINQQIL